MVVRATTKRKNAWQNNTVAELFEFGKSNTFSRDMLNYENGTLKDIHYGDILTRFGAIVDVSARDVPFVNKAIAEQCTCGTLLHDGDIVLADTAEDEAVGKACEICGTDGVSAVSGLHTIVLRPLQRSFVPRYLGYYFNSTVFHNQLLPYIQGTKVSTFTKASLKSCAIFMPSEDEQRAIAEVLSDIDALIDELEKLIKKKQKVRAGVEQALFLEMRRLPNYEQPWRTVVLKDIVFLRKETIKTSDFDKALYVGTDNMLQNREGVLPNSIEYSYDTVRRYLSKDTLISNIRPYLKKIWLAQNEGGCSNDVLVFRSKNDSEVDPAFLYYLLSRDNFFAYMNKTAQGTKMPRGDKSLIMDYTCRIPSDLNEQKAIAEMLETIERDIKKMEMQLAKYQQIKQGMMSELLSGNIRLVKE